jgi:8-oxo-dGTP diphosphatase
MIAVAVAIIQDRQGRVLLTQRQQHQDFSGYWEFPGGKLEANESPEQALVREVQEELAIQVDSMAFMMTFPWQYDHKSVLFHVWRVTEWQGEPRAQEGQTMQWVAVSALPEIPLPTANALMVQALMA